jgi:TolB-like protein
MTPARFVTRALLPLLVGAALAPRAAAAQAPRPTAAPAAPAAPSAPRVVAVLPLSVEASDTLLTPLGYALADFLATDLSRSQRLTLVERARLGAILRELALGAGGVTDSATAPRAGRLLQARTLVTGALTRRAGNEMVFAARLTDAADGRTTGGFTGRAPLASVLDAEKAIAFRLFEQLGVQLTPRERALVEERPTRNLTALLAYGQGVQAEVNGQYAAAHRAFRRAAAADPSFRQASARADGVRAQAVRASGTALNRVNRPLELTPATLRPGLATDPALRAAQSEIVITINTP